MGRPKGRTSGPKEPKRTPTKVRPVLRKSGGKVTEPWAIMERLLKDDPAFQQIKNCRIKLFWQKDWREDPDGIVKGAQVCKASEIDRNLLEESAGGESVDIFIKLPEKAWGQYNDTTKEQLIFHNLCHVHPAMDSNGEQKQDTKGRPLWRIGKHPIETFHEELAKYGAEAVIGNNQAVLDAMRDADQPLIKEMERATKEKEAQASASAAPAPSGKPGPKAAELTAAKKAESIGALKLADGITNKLIDANIVTLGDFQALLAKKGSFWAEGVKGIGRDLGGKVEDAYNNFLFGTSATAAKGKRTRI